MFCTQCISALIWPNVGVVLHKIFLFLWCWKLNNFSLRFFFYVHGLNSQILPKKSFLVLQYSSFSQNIFDFFIQRKSKIKLFDEKFRVSFLTSAPFPENIKVQWLNHPSLPDFTFWSGLIISRLNFHPRLFTEKSPKKKHFGELFCQKNWFYEKVDPIDNNCPYENKKTFFQIRFVET